LSKFWLRQMPARLLVPALALALSACASVPRIPYTQAEADRATIHDNPQIRTWADTPDRRFLLNTQGVRQAIARSGQRTEYLALSGGGGDGAFGAGVLNGWSESGTRPVLSIVSGVSTGALIAPFAFLGSAYDPVIKEIYTSGIAETLLDTPDPISAVFGSSIFSNDRLRTLVDRFITPEIVAEIAAARDGGRLLFVVTTNLDRQRPVLWDMGAIAKEGTPQAIRLFRTILIASSAIPAVFPPVLIDATADGHAFQELHVDGTVTSTVFTLPESYLLQRTAIPGLSGGTLYVLMNSKAEPDFQVVDNTAPQIGARTFSTFVKDQARTDLALAERVAKRSGIGFRLASIGRDYPTQSGVGFDTAYMRKLYEYGYEQGRSGRFWHTTLPGGIEPPKEAMARR
jgi:hypothetical protein